MRLNTIGFSILGIDMKKKERDEEYEKTNREKALTAHPGLFWCGSCDMSLVGDTGKCPVCGKRNNKKKKRGF